MLYIFFQVYTICSPYMDLMANLLECLFPPNAIVLGSLIPPLWLPTTHCHDFPWSRSLSLFGRRSAVDVTGLLAIADPLFIFHLFCLCLIHLVRIPQLLVHYLPSVPPCLFVSDCLLYCGPYLWPCIITTCIVIYLSKIAFITHICCPAPDSSHQLHTDDVTLCKKKILQ